MVGGRASARRAGAGSALEKAGSPQVCVIYPGSEVSMPTLYGIIAGVVVMAAFIGVLIVSARRR
jgi:hypothetical protein